MPRMERRRTVRWLAAAIISLAPVTSALARTEEPEKDIYDARLEGYANSATLPSGGTGLIWCGFVFLGVLCCAGMFKDARRTHLD
jgi:hypothetical protein